MTATPDIKPIETRYAGCRFRSRLEARWAVFFDALNIPWLYEPQGYELGGDPYLPDFLLYPNTDLATWFEVKGKFPTETELNKAELLSRATSTRTFVYFGECRVPGVGLSSIGSPAYYDRVSSTSYWHWDNSEGWMLLPDNPEAPLSWQVGLPPTAFMFAPGHPERLRPRSRLWWWTDCHHCGRVVLKLHGQMGWCPALREDRLPDPLYPQWGHETARLLKAYTAARSARFEYGESGALR